MMPLPLRRHFNSATRLCAIPLIVILAANACPAVAAGSDIDNSGTVDIGDLVILITNWKKTGANVADINGDSIVNILDLVVMITDWGSGGSEPTPGPSDVVVYDDDMSGYGTLVERRARRLALEGAGQPFYFFDASGDLAEESIIAPGMGSSPYAYRVTIPAVTAQVTTNGTLFYRVAASSPPFAPDTALLFADFWVRINMPSLDWIKWIEFFHPGADRTEWSPFIPQGHSAGPWNVMPQSNNKPVWMHVENGAEDAPKTYKRWSDVSTNTWLKFTVAYRKSSGTGTATDGIARMWINGEKVIDASLDGLNTGWMVDRGAGQFNGNVGWSGSALTGREALRYLADDPVNNIVWPGIVSVRGTGGTLDLGRIRIWYRP